MMEKIKEGYKKTEVGVIPEDWNYTSIGNKIDLLTGFPFQSIHFSKDGIRLLKGLNIKRGETDWSEDQITYWNKDLSKYKKFELKQGDLVISMDGSLVGRSYAYLEKSDLPALLLQRVARIRSNQISVAYLRQFVGSNYFISHSDAVKTVTAIPHISPKDIRDFKIPLPPTLAEQKAIATALSDVDELIQSLDKLIAKKKAIKQGSMQRLLKSPAEGGQRLPGFSGEWEVKKLGDIIIIRSGESPSKFKFSDSGIPFYKVEQLNIGNKYQKETPYYIQIETPVEKGSLIFPKRGASILLNKIRILSQDSFMDTNLMTLTPGDEIYNEYLFYYLVDRGLSQVADTTSIPQINNKHIIPYQVLLPRKEEQKAIAQILSDMDQEIEVLEQKQEKYKAIKHGMMQELLTGKKRLVN